tara:strand:+ start:1074 stop:1982 length:909 start_codon:yes stop_codon:yes gene_type:complete
MNNLIVRIAEGLGNQLFMYANAFALSKKINYNLFIDNESAYFKKKNIEKYQLHNFNISTNICEDKFKYNSYIKDFQRKILILSNSFRKEKNFLLEKKNEFKKTKYFDFTNNSFSKILFIEGHYETEKYFKDYKDQLKLEFSLKNLDSYKKNKYSELIKKNPNIVSICIRQNRFSERINNRFNKNNIITSENFTKKTIDYIFRAVTHIDNKFDNIKYLVWSNDFKDLRNYFPENKFMFIDNQENKSLNDFYLLLNCKNFIVGPTSFHWWPAWLNSDQNSLIFRPKDLNASDNYDFWPNNWMSI